MESECCGYRASCSFDVCGPADADKMRLKTLDADFTCSGLECTAHECCEWAFDGFKRTTDYLTTDLTPGDEYSTPKDAFDACPSSNADCDGFTCRVGGTAGDGQAMGPCYLAESGGTGDGTVANSDGHYLVTFLKVTCSQSVCDAVANMILKVGADLPSTCAAACTTSECCVEQGLCADRSCPESYVSGGSVGTGRCAGSSCTLGECCDPKDTCDASLCTSGTHIPKVEDLPLYCTDTSCEENECCDERAQCSAGVCGSTHVLKPAAMPMPIGSSGRCVGRECTLGECCRPRAACQESICDDNTHIFQPTVSLCAGTACIVSECCAERATCDVSACGTTHVLAPESDRVARCDTDVCTADECCVAKGQCSREVCDTQSFLMDDPPSLCDDATCTSAECCSMCPFVGEWQSTSVFGGDALTVEASDNFDSGYQVTMAAAMGVFFEFEIRRHSESAAECQCIVKLDSLTLAAGEMSERRDRISWDTILNNDVWMPRGSRRLDSKRSYEIKDGAIAILPLQRRLQQQDVRMDFEIETASENDMVQLQSALEVMDLMEIEFALKRKLVETTNFTIGSVYMTDNLESQTVVVPGQRTSGASRSDFSGIWMSMSAIAALCLMW